MNWQTTLLYATCLGLACMTRTLSAQEAPEIPIPADRLACLIEHQEKYLSLPRQLIIFFADLCPAVSREEVAALVKNSAEVDEKEGQRLIMLKSDFSCLIQKIEAHIETSETDAESDTGIEAELNGTIVFRLDCS